MLHRQALVPTSPPPRAFGRLKRAAAALGALGVLLGLAAPAQAQQVTVDSITNWGCAADNFTFDATFTGFSGPGWNALVLVTQAGQVVTDQGLGGGNQGNTSGPLTLRSVNGGRVTGAWPLAENTPFTVTITTANWDTGLLGYVTTVQVSQCNTGGVIQSNTTAPYSPSTARLPGPISGLRATPGDSQIALQWDAPTALGTPPLTGYYVTYKEVGATGALKSAPGCAPTPTAAPGCTISGLVNGTEYEFQVRAANAHGSSASQPSLFKAKPNITHAITATANPAAGGTVTCSPNPVPNGSNASCTATANAGYTFTGFDGACTGLTCNLTNVTSAKTVTAKFALKSYTITATAVPVEGGTVSCTPNPVLHGNSASCTAAPAEGYIFNGFGDACSGLTCNLTNVTNNRTVSAIFERKSYTISTTSIPGAGGVVTCMPTNPVPHGDNTSCMAEPAVGYVFTRFEGACSGATCNLLNVTGPKSVTAIFEARSHHITTTSNPAAGGTVTCSPNPVPERGTTTCTPSAHAGYHFSDFWDACTGTSCTLTNVTAPKNVLAHFYSAREFGGITKPVRDPGAPALATFEGGGAACAFDPAETRFVDQPAPPPVGELEQGMFQFKLVNCDPGSTVTMKVTWPKPVHEVFKFGRETSTATFDYYFTPAPGRASASGRVTEIVVTDGQQGDNDWLPNGIIIDPVGPLYRASSSGGGSSLTAVPVPTLSQWALMLLGLGAAGLGARRLQRTRRA